ncbi:DUF4041 domain-containing protein [Cellulomonas bogoriensis]|uniref:ATPase n=1 Tax=Cellulomonas bogoriensis 69B4 = DSM 16987 TaxID=1386082 RepID=A0A0A0C0S6_9CELL|nr:DUF4041 domain-containing protein [Cellulomonas bogoriensis]KGM13572.1 ATPase [Cellulomonas bogoriensis 69B4 = DSM 16987]
MRRHARELAEELETLRTEVSSLETELARVGAMDAVSIERERAAAAARLEADHAAHAARLAEMGAELARAEQAHADRLGRIADEQAVAERALADVRSRVVELEETALLQEVGVYEYQHPLQNADAYRERLTALRGRIKAMARKDGGAIEAATGWTVNGSAGEGRRMVSQTSKLMLRAYNAEADALVRALRPHRLAASIDRLEKTAATIAKLGTSMSIRVSRHYHKVRIDEMRLSADYLAKVEEEKEAERAAREVLREQRKVEQEMARAREKLTKEREHYLNALAALRAKGDDEAAARMEAQLADVDRAIEDVDYRTANQRAGYVYVISNIGSMGDGMIKVGMTRRLDPMDRVRELGDASVPFGFDVHALFFSDDAVGIEAAMHQRLADRRVNRVNLRREFFYATPHEALEHLRDLAGEVLSFEEVPEALEYRQSRTLSGNAPRGVDGE